MNMPCGHDESNRDITVETRTVICRMCDIDDRRRDAELREKELFAELTAIKQQNADLTAEVERLRGDVRELAKDWADEHSHLQSACRKAGIEESKIVGDSYAVPGIMDLADILGAELERLKRDLCMTEAERDAARAEVAEARRVIREIATHVEGKAVVTETDLRNYAAQFYYWMKDKAKSFLARSGGGS